LMRDATSPVNDHSLTWDISAGLDALQDESKRKYKGNAGEGQLRASWPSVCGKRAAG